MKRYYKYYRIENDNDFSIEGAIFTKKELKKEIIINRCRNIAYKPVKVLNTDIYFFFGQRFSDNYIYIDNF